MRDFLLAGKAGFWQLNLQKTSPLSSMTLICLRSQ